MLARLSPLAASFTPAPRLSVVTSLFNCLPLTQAMTAALRASLPEGLTLSAVAGIALPTGAFAISGGVSPYVQTSWSRDLGEGWSLNSMQTATWYPDQPAGTANFETTLSLERDITPRADAFVEYVGDYHTLGIAGHVFDLGGAYHLTALQQVDFHAGLGLNRASPHFYIGLGYSFRLDHLTGGQTQF